MRKLLNTYFSISKREFNGLLVLVMLILLIAAMPRAYRALAPTHRAQLNFREITQALEAKKKQHEMKRPNYPRKRKEAHHRVVQKLFSFDPNIIGLEDWQKLGLSARQSAAIINYKNKGGRFRRAEDLQKMYTISDEMYQRLLPYVKIAPAVRSPTLDLKVPDFQKSKSLNRGISVIEVNCADSATLVEIRGIGPTFASRILRYRQRLGGFHHVAQLMEVYGLDSIKFIEIKGQITLDPARLRKIDINYVQIEDFRGHPYIKYKQANALIQYRKQHGNYTDIADLSKVLILDAETINRLAPYINFKQ